MSFFGLTKCSRPSHERETGAISGSVFDGRRGRRSVSVCRENSESVVIQLIKSAKRGSESGLDVVLLSLLSEKVMVQFI